ncbi:MAG: RluA family pseudouridine synthase [Bacteroidota bacterium]
MTQALPVLYEDNHLIVVNKSSGALVQGDRTGDETLSDQVKAYIKRKYKKPGDVFLGVVHRLDRPVSGAVLFGRTSKGLERMTAQFRDREVKKTYWAIVKDQPSQTAGELTHWLKKDREANRTKAFNKEGKGTHKATLHYKLISRVANYYLLEVKPLTGRPHQIRVQLSKIGCAILGDVKYGGTKQLDRQRIYLHARSLEFLHPVKKEPVRIDAGIPKDQIWQLFN